MKIIHSGDLHLDSALNKNNTSNSKERKEELLLAFKNMVDYAKKENVKVIILAGDVFDSKKVNIKTQNFVINLINSNKNISFLYLKGNHDEDNFIEKLDIIPGNLKYFSNSWNYYNFDNVVIAGINEIEGNYDTLYLDKNNFNIVTLHGQINSQIKLNKLTNKNIDYLALGHIHQYSMDKLDNRGIYAYCGCLEGRGFDEPGTKGFILIDTELKEYKFIENSIRVVHELSFDITSFEDWYDFQNDVINKLKEIPSKDIVEVIITGKYNIHVSKYISSLQNELSRKFYFAKVTDKSSLLYRKEDYANSISLTKEFIDLVESQDFDQSLKEKIIDLGLMAIRNGDDLS